MDQQTQGRLEMAAAMALSGTIGVFAYFTHASEVTIVFWRCVLGGAVLAIVCWHQQYLRREVLNRRVLLLSLLGGAALIANWVFLFAAYKRASISISGLVYNLQPFILSALSAVFLRERIRRDHIGWAIVGLAGLATVAMTGSEMKDEGEFLLGIMFAVLAALFYALAALSARMLRGTPPHSVALIQFAAGAVVLWPITGASLPELSFGPLASLITLGVLHTGIMYILLYGGFQKLNPGTAAALSFINPIVTILSESLVLHRTFSALQYLGGAVLLVAVLGVNFGGRLRSARTAISHTK